MLHVLKVLEPRPLPLGQVASPPHILQGAAAVVVPPPSKRLPHAPHLRPPPCTIPQQPHHQRHLQPGHTAETQQRRLPKPPPALTHLAEKTLRCSPWVRAPHLVALEPSGGQDLPQLLPGLLGALLPALLPLLPPPGSSSGSSSSSSSTSRFHHPAQSSEQQAYPPSPVPSRPCSGSLHQQRISPSAGVGRCPRAPQASARQPRPS